MNYCFAYKDSSGEYDIIFPDEEYELKSGEPFYILISKEYLASVSKDDLNGDGEENDGYYQITKISMEVKTSKPSGENITANILLWQPTSTELQSWQNMMTVRTISEGTSGKAETRTLELPSLTGDLLIAKIDADTGVPLADFGFKIKNTDLNLWVNYDAANGNISYSATEATEFYTDREFGLVGGLQGLRGLLVGNYQIIETVAQSGYVADKVVDTTITSGQQTGVVIENEKSNVTIAGNVWLDGSDGKSTSRDNLYGEGDSSLSGIKVSCWNWKDNANYGVTYTNQYGFYSFQVPKSALPYINIDFMYDGLQYEAVQMNLDENVNGSKAKESPARREKFNYQFECISKKYIYNSDSNTILTGNTSGVFEFDYTDTTDYKASIEKNDKYNSNVLSDEYVLVARVGNNPLDGGNCSGFSFNSTGDIYGVDFGLYEREQPDLALIQDINNVKLSVNGKEHVYKYANRYKSAKDKNDDLCDVGVKFGNEYNSMTYTRAIYKSDYSYIAANNNDKSKELEVFVTYEVKVNNQSTSLDSEVFTIEYNYDNNYEFIGAGYGLDEDKSELKGIIGKDKISDGVSDVPEKYRILIIDDVDEKLKIGPGREESIYLQFKLSRAKVEEMLKDKKEGETSDETFINIAEIGSYRTWKDGRLYAGLDKDSVPGNVIPGDMQTYEDDTDKGADFKLEQGGEREISGKVFLDSTTGELKTGEPRNGSGIYEQNEKGIPGVTVKLKETSGTAIKNTTTNQNGDFTISGFKPGDYQLIYTWGGQQVDGKEITVQDYKSTIQDKNRENQDGTWYKGNIDSRYSDAFDDYTTRKKIDEELKEYSQNSIKNKPTTYTSINALTHSMDISIENSISNLTQYLEGEKPEFIVRNVDFGIVERPRQEIELTKRVKTLKLTLANGQAISNVEFTYDSNGKLKATGEKRHMTFMGTEGKGDTNRFIKVELDNELIQGAILEVGYEISFYNKSELDYENEYYYKYGELRTSGHGFIEGEDSIRTIKPTTIIDYLDKEWSFESAKNLDENGNEIWKVKTLQELKNEGIVAKEVYEAKDDITNELILNKKIILVTEKLGEKAIEPRKSTSVMLNVSKVLANADEISFGNEIETIKLEKPKGGRPIPPSVIPGDYIPGITPPDDASDTSEEIMILPSTGENLNYVLPITIGLISLITLGTGVLLIKKKVLNNKD